MNAPMIENSERGITLNKSLAWTMLVAVLAGGVWIGTQVTEAKKGVETLTERQSEDRNSIVENRAAIVLLRENTGRIDERLTNIEKSTDDINTSIKELIGYLRDQNLKPEAP